MERILAYNSEEWMMKTRSRKKKEKNPGQQGSTI